MSIPLYLGARNSMTRLWFKAKKYGYGWYPATWEGMVVILAFIILHTLGVLLLLASLSRWPSGPVTLWFSLFFILNTATLIAICIKKGERPRWRWGEDSKKDQR